MTPETTHLIRRDPGLVRRPAAGRMVRGAPDVRDRSGRDPRRRTLSDPELPADASAETRAAARGARIGASARTPEANACGSPRRRSTASGARCPGGHAAATSGTVHDALRAGDDAPADARAPGARHAGRRRRRAVAGATRSPGASAWSPSGRTSGWRISARRWRRSRRFARRDPKRLDASRAARSRPPRSSPSPRGPALPPEVRPGRSPIPSRAVSTDRSG